MHNLYRWDPLRSFRILSVLVLFSLLLAGATALAQPAGCPTGMTGYWKLNELSGGPYADYYGSNNATCTNCPDAVTGKLGGAQDFNGTDDQLNIPDNGSFDWTASSSFTIEFWMKSAACQCTVGGFDCNQVIAGRAAAGWWIGMNCQTPNNVGKLRCYFGATTDFFSVATVGDDQWHHIVYTRDNAANTYNLYIDGTLDRTITAAGAARSGSDPLQLGYFNSSPFYRYYGALDEFALYNAALPLSEIQAHYNSGNGTSYCASAQPPVVSDIPDQTILEGGSFATINLDDYVADPDTPDNQISWIYSGNSALSVSITNRVATISAPNSEWSGAETVTFTATDPSSLSDSDPATFTVTAVNDAPVVSDIPGQSIAEGGTFTTISLDDYVSDIDNTDAQITWTYSGSTDLTVSIVDRVATISIPNSDWNGSETITFLATDPGLLSGSDPAIFVVTAVNDPPVVSDIPGQTIAEGSSFVQIALDDYVADIDNDDDEISWSHSGASQLTVSIVNRIATISTSNADWFGSETITFTATDPDLASDSDPAAFVVTAVNDAPVVSDIPGQTIPEGGSFTTIALDDYVSDVDNTDDQMTWSYSGNSSLTVSIVNRVATISTPGVEWSGSEVITFTATDPGTLFDSDAATFVVTAVNDAPVVSDIPNQTISEGGTFASVSLDNYVSDVDNTDNQMTWTYSGNSSLTVSIVNRVATISTPDPEWSGSEVITFTATDPGSEFDSDAATFVVTAANDAPVVSDIPNQTISEGGTFASISLDNYVSDVDNTDNQMTWTFSGNSSLIVSIVNRVATITTPNPEWSGSEVITFKATDPGLEFDSDAATFTVTAQNDAPVVSDIPDQTITEGGSFTTIALDDYVSDVDNADNQMAWTYSGNSSLTVSIVNRVATISTPNPEWSGSEVISFTATDPGLLFDSDAATFTVTAVNDAPVVSEIPDQSVLSGASFTAISLDDFVADPDNADNEITWTYSGNVDLSVSISPTRIATITAPSPAWLGSEQIVFTATDPGLLFDTDAAVFSRSSTGCPPQMVHYWHLDESSGPYDDSYGTTDATCTNCPAPASGRVGTAQKFDGVNDQIGVPDDGSFDWTATSSFSIEFWMKTPGCACTESGFNCNQVVIGRSTAASGGWWIGLNCQTNGNIGKLRCYFGSADFYSNASLGDDVWHHIVCEFDHTASLYSLFIDGALDRSFTASGQNRAGTGVMEVGYFATGFRYSGWLDELALYDRSLTIAEAAEHYAAGLAGNGYCAAGIAPQITSTPATTAVGNREYSYDMEATGVPVPGYGILSGPEGMTVNQTSGMVLWTPTEVGDYSVSLVAFNSAGADTQGFSISVPGLAPLITSMPDTALTAGKPYQYDVESIAAPAPSYFLSAEPPLTVPQGMTINPTTGLIQWTPQTSGVAPLQVQACNQYGCDIQHFTLVVTPVAPLITSTPDTLVTKGDVYFYDIETSGVPVPRIVLESGPPGIQFDSVATTLTWLTTASGRFAIKLSATNSGGADTQSFLVRVVDPLVRCAPSMQHLWPMDEITQGSLADFVGVNNLSCASACPSPANGTVFGAQSFGGSGVGVTAADDGSFDWTAGSNFAIEFWMRMPTAPTLNEVIVGRSQANWWVGIYAANPLVAGVTANHLLCFFNGQWVQSNAAVCDDVWHHVVCQRDAMTGLMMLYVDGVLNTTSLVNQGYVGSAPLSVGWYDAPLYYRYTGLLDELALYSSVLQPTTIASHHTGGISGHGYCRDVVCGDADANDLVTISDAVFVINYIFAGGSQPWPLLAADADCNRLVSISDVVYVISYIFGGGPVPCAACQ